MIGVNPRMEVGASGGCSQSDEQSAGARSRRYWRAC
jgi:hypothetical protein